MKGVAKSSLLITILTESNLGSNDDVNSWRNVDVKPLMMTKIYDEMMKIYDETYNEMTKLYNEVILFKIHSAQETSEHENLS